MNELKARTETKPVGDRTRAGEGVSQSPAVIDARQLLEGRREATIMLDGEAYRLRITAKDKLILTK